jgi:tonB-dependent receptor
MFHRIFTILSLLLSHVSVKAALPTDTLNRTIDLAQVVVTGTRTPKLLANTPVLTSVITRSDIEKADATNLRDLLQTSMPGIEFSYAMNQQTHINFAGFGGQSLLILVDGERLAGETMDDVDFTRLSMDNVERIEIVRGAASALYGSNAAGGVINIITRSATQPFKLNLNARVARHNEWRQGMSLQLKGGKWANLLALNHTSIDNYDVTNGPSPLARVVTTIYGDKTWNGSNQLSFKPLEGLKLTGRAGYFFRETARTADTPERYRDFSGGLRALWQPSQNQQLELSYSFDQYDKSTYFKLPHLDIRSYSNVQNAFRLLYTLNLRQGDVLSVGADYLHDWLMNPNLEGRTRKQRSCDVFAQYDLNLGEKLELVGALRLDHFSDNPITRLTPKLSVRHTPLRHLNLRFGYGMGFRSPTLKEKFYNFDMAGIWLVTGNPNLKAETSHNFNLSAEYSRLRYNFTLSGHYNLVSDKIATGAPFLANPSDPIPHLPYVNLARYSVLGFEATAKAKWQNGMSAQLSYCFTHERLPKDKDGKQINNQYLPARKHTFTAHWDWSHRFNKTYQLAINVDGRALSPVDNLEYVDYYDLSKGTNTIHYPAYTLWKVSAVQQFGSIFTLTLSVDNVLNYRPEYHYLNSPLTDGANFMVGAAINL